MVKQREQFSTPVVGEKTEEGYASLQWEGATVMPGDGVFLKPGSGRWGACYLDNVTSYVA